MADPLTASPPAVPVGPLRRRAKRTAGARSIAHLVEAFLAAPGPVRWP